jgi:phosphodiesterase/alkaline phosphatase D-like protein
MWKLIQDKVESNEVQVVLHLGDQVYGQKELVDSFVILRQAKQDGIDTPEGIKAVSERVQGRLADIYRFTWNLPRTAKSLASGSHLMIWSDNDLYNDFTIAKSDSGAAIENLMIHYGHLVYRRYQRQLWDPDYESNTSPSEEHFHKYGPIGILLIDMRGNRIDWDGNQHADNPIVNEAQWKLIDSVFADPELKVILVCSEIPFVGDTPEVAKQNATKPGTEFLKDHWVYSTAELERLLETAFDWKAKEAGKREVVFIAGDIHVGVDSEIRDSKTNSTIRHLTATPITNHVCKFFPALEGAVNERFSYVHKPLSARNYGLVDITIAEDGTPKVAAQLVEDPNPKSHH